MISDVKFTAAASVAVFVAAAISVTTFEVSEKKSCNKIIWNQRLPEADEEEEGGIYYLLFLSTTFN